MRRIWKTQRRLKKKMRFQLMGPRSENRLSFALFLQQIGSKAVYKNKEHCNNLRVEYLCIHHVILIPV